MKKLLLTVVCCMLLVGVALAKEFKAEKFETVYTITFNAITLEEASRLEDVIKKKFKDACKIEVNLNEGAGDPTSDVSNTVVFDSGWIQYRGEE